MTNDIDLDIREALDTKAGDIELPAELAERTLAFARDQSPQPLWGRMKAWRDARKMRERPSSYPRGLAAAGAVACAVLFFVVGTVVTRPSDVRPTTRAIERTSGDEARSATRGTSPATPRAKDSRDTETSSGFVGLTGGSATQVQVGRNGSLIQGGDAIGGQVAGVVSSGDASVDTVRGNTSEDADAESGDGEFSDQAVEVETGDARAEGRSRGAAVGAIAAPPRADGPFLDPKLVKAADIRVAVEDFDPAWEAANDVAAKFGGAVVNSRTQQVSDRIAQGTVTMRVPSPRLDAVLEELRNLGTLARLNTSGDDIAEQIDQNKRKIEDVRAEEAELLEMQRRAATVSEQLEVKRRLEDVRRNIDSLRKKQKNYEDQVEFSAVTATIFEDESVADDGSVLARAFDTGISAALTILAGTLVILAALLPIALLATAVWFGVGAIRRRRPGAEE